MDIILCGAGKRGKELYSFLKYLTENEKRGKVIGFIDNNPEIDHIEDIPVYEPQMLNENGNNIIYIITPMKKEIIEFYKKRLLGKKYVIYRDYENLADIFNMDLTAMRREICAYWHVDNMDWYFDEAESQNKLSVFWDENSEFKKMFNCLDLTNVVELACGRGRHVAQYLHNTQHVTIVDILQKNIDYCKKRYGNNDKISYYKNDGYNLADLPSGSFTSLFSYDAMVHFEMMDINSYLIDIYRILQTKGRVLLHHSNLDAFSNGSYLGNSLHGRTFMNYKIFAYLAIHAGFDVIKQQIICWEGIENLDCITLLEKNN